MKEEWGYAEKRKNLIKMVEAAIKGGNPTMAMDMVDAVIVSVWDHYGLVKTTPEEKNILLCND